jgi:hypothetical protein
VGHDNRHFFSFGFSLALTLIALGFTSSALGVVRVSLLLSPNPHSDDILKTLNNFINVSQKLLRIFDKNFKYFYN